MSRYFFDVDDSLQVTDRQGMPLIDINAASDHAVTLALEFVRTSTIRRDKGGAVIVTVRDEAGANITTVRLAISVEGS